MTEQAPPATQVIRAGGRWSWIAAAVAFVIVVMAITPVPVGIWADDGHYVILGKALAAGEGLRYINLPGAPPGVHFPPGYPFVLAGLWLIAPDFPANVAVFQFANATFVAIAAFWMVRLCEQVLGLSSRVALATAVVWSVSIPTLMLATAVMSEALWWALLLPGVVASERVARHGGSRSALVAGLLLGASLLVRSIGVTAVVATISVLAWRKRWRELALLSGSVAVLIAPWLAWKSAHTVALPATVEGMYGGYGAWMLEGYATNGLTLLQSTLAANSIGVVRGITAYWSIVPGIIGWWLAVLLLGLTAVGAWQTRRRGEILLVTLACYTGVVLVWPFAPDRFVCGAAVLWMPIAAAGAQATWRLGRRWLAVPRFISAIPAAIAAGAIVAGTLMAVPTRGWAVVPGRDPANVLPLTEWALRNTAPGSLLMADAETFVYLYTQRQAVPPVPYTAIESAGALSREKARAAFAEALSYYNPDWVLAMTAPSVRAAEELAIGEQPRLMRMAVLPVGAAYAVRSRNVRRAPVTP